MSLGIFVEGPSDRTTIPILLGKMTQETVHVRIVAQGDMLNVDEMSRQIVALKQTQPDVNKVFVFRDSEGTDPDVTYKQTLAPRAELSDKYPSLKIEYIIVDHSLEGWLLCDLVAVKQVLGSNAKVRIHGNPDNNPRPAKLLERVFKANGKEYRKTTHNQRIATLVTPKTVRASSPTFDRLINLVT